MLLFVTEPTLAQIMTPVCDRTAGVRDAIVDHIRGVTTCGDVTTAQLAAISTLDLEHRNLTELKAGDFSGLPGVKKLILEDNFLTRLDREVLSDLSNLEIIVTWNNPLRGSLQPGNFSSLTKLVTLDLRASLINRLPAGVFSGLTRLETIALFGNELEDLPDNVFSGLPVLKNLYVPYNRLTELPGGLFSGLTGLQNLYLMGNYVDPLPLEVSLEPIGQARFRATAHTGAPFALVLPIHVTNGTVDGGATSTTIPAGSLASAGFTVSRMPGTSGVVTVDIGTFPRLPQGHEGYAFVKSAELPLEVFFSETPPPPPPFPPPPPPQPSNNSPTADAGPDQTGVWEGALVMLDGSGSSDPDGDPLRYRWNQFSGERVVLSSQNIVNPTFTAPEGLTAEAVLSFRLLVTDPIGHFDSDTVTVTVDPDAEPPPPEDRIYFFPHLAVGAGWQTTITYINYSPEEVTCQTDLISDHGTPLMVSFAALGTVVSRPDVLPPVGSIHQESNVDLNASLAPGWARVNCSGPVKASLLYRLHNSEGVPTAEAGVNATSVPATRFVTFAEQGEDRFGTGVAYANPSAISVPVTFTARDTAGEVLASVVRTLSPGGHDARGMAELFGLTSFTGSIEVTSTEPIVSLSLNFEADPVFSSLPPGELEAAAQ